MSAFRNADIFIFPDGMAFRTDRNQADGLRAVSSWEGLRAAVRTHDSPIGVEHKADFLGAILMVNQVLVPSLGCDSDKLVRRGRAKFANSGLGARFLVAYGCR